MSNYNVEAYVGTVYATVEAESEEEAMALAIYRWVEEASDLFTAATFEVRKADG